ncbi:hypothetical protein T01_9193 [Trichinella spiralis]|uniref:Uncharacterized protein n=1 Tax=Trichinella spiralis TaxID=6334 RepID=A0A0V1BAJ5_TRISP|nr:hypothetical protein T01_9193 [Trichinella spiralis]
MPLGMDDLHVFVSSELEIPAKGESKPSYNDIVQLYKLAYKWGTQLQLHIFKLYTIGEMITCAVIKIDFPHVIISVSILQCHHHHHKAVVVDKFYETSLIFQIASDP